MYMFKIRERVSTLGGQSIDTDEREIEGKPDDEKSRVA